MKIINFYKQFFRDNKPWFVAVLLWFFVCVGVGFVAFSYYPGLLDYIVQMLQNVVGDATGRHLFWAIFLNNLVASLIAMVAGLVVGIFPLLMTGLNGFLLGYLGAALFAQDQIPLFDRVLFFIGSLVPHGVIELPIIILAAAVGLRLGFGWVIAEFRQGKAATVFKGDVVNVVAAVPIVVVGLVIAALIEAYVTSFIVKLLL